MQCKRCGAKNEKGSDVCQKCGTALNPASEMETTISLQPIDIDEESVEINLAPDEGPLLVVKKGPNSGQKFNLAKKEITLGRDPGSDIFLDDVTVSRHHAKISMARGRVNVTDSGSLNGTYVNSELVEDTRVLQSDDELQIGKFKLIFLSKT